jgi:hypothetical protein
MREMGNAYNILAEKRERKIPLGRNRRRWEDNIIMDLKETGCEGVYWIQLAHDRVHCTSRIITIQFNY